MALLVSGTLPGVMAENSGTGDWFGQLQVTSSRGTIASIEAIGPGASYLSLTWDPLTGTVALQPDALADYEGFLALGAAPELVFSLQARMANGRIDSDSQTFRIALLDIDDTPPAALAFATGGSVVAGEIGSIIGTLAVTDPDTPPGEPFFFTLPEEDDWRFEVVGGTTLKLRDGISLGLDDMPLRPLYVTVSDGRQGAGFTLDITVLDPGAPPPPTPVLTPGEERGAVALPGPERAVVLRERAALLDLGPASGGERPLTVQGQAEAALPASVTRVDFLDARLELDGAGPAARAAALLRVLEGPEVAPATVAAGVAALEAGAALVELAGARVAAGSDSAFVTGLFRDGAGRDPEAAELALHLGRLGSGESRAQVAVDVALLHATTSAPVWLPWLHGRDAPPPDVVPVVPSGPVPDFAADLLLG